MSHSPKPTHRANADVIRAKAQLIRSIALLIGTTSASLITLIDEIRKLLGH